MRRRAAAVGLGVALALLGAGGLPAQTVPPAVTGDAPVVALPRVPVVTLDDERLFTESRFGKAVLARQEADKQALIAENRKIEAGLEAEERDLTERRASLPKEEFEPLAAAFNTKVEGIRAAQDAKSRAITDRFDAERQRFLVSASPVLVQIMAERGAVAIISKRAVIAGFDNIDITEAAIARLDATLGDGGAGP